MINSLPAEDQNKANGEEPAEEAKPFIEARVQLVLAIALEIGFNSRSRVKRLKPSMFFGLAAKRWINKAIA